MTVKNNAKAVDRLKDVLKGQGIKVIVDSRTQTNLKKGQGKQFLVYAENVKIEELGTILRQLGLAHEPTSVAGRISMLLSHPLTVGRALLRGTVSRAGARG